VARKIALVACVKTKKPMPMPAQDLYSSDWFRKASTYAMRVADEWHILSAKHGWGVGSSGGRAIRERERPLERAVSQHIRSMPFLWIGIEDEPGPASLRGYIERNAIALLSNYNFQDNPIDPSSSDWLGHWTTNDYVQRSGLWNVNHVAETYDPGFLDILPEQIRLTRKPGA
jgi:hypothetical protein